MIRLPNPPADRTRRHSTSVPWHFPTRRQRARHIRQENGSSLHVRLPTQTAATNRCPGKRIVPHISTTTDHDPIGAERRQHRGSLSKSVEKRGSPREISHNPNSPLQSPDATMCGRPARPSSTRCPRNPLAIPDTRRRWQNTRG
jgi:hypothetical protein